MVTAAYMPFILNATTPTDSSATWNNGIDLGYGQFRVVVDLTARDTLPADERVEGMWVYVEDKGRIYTLVGGITNSDWRVRLSEPSPLFNQVFS